MRPNKKTERLIDEFDVDVNTDKDREILDELICAQQKTKKTSTSSKLFSFINFFIIHTIIHHLQQ